MKITFSLVSVTVCQHFARYAGGWENKIPDFRVERVLGKVDVVKV